MLRAILLEIVMLGRQAKTLSLSMQARLLTRVRDSPWPARDRVIVLLSMRAGLRAGEIAQLTWGMVLNAEGAIAEVMSLPGQIAKYRSGRRIPLHRDLRYALRILYRTLPVAAHGPHAPVVRSARGSAMRPNSIVNWFTDLYRELKLEGCSSHSGRRTFITNAARKVHQAGASLRDVQMLAGHRSIETTQRYIDGDSAAQRKLVGLI
ncbi:MAG: site-specific integrase [Hyphomicrobium sp.]